MIMYLIPFLAVAQASSSCFLWGDVKEPFSNSEVETMRNLFLKNINIDGKGGVVAAPDYDTPGGSYYFHWMRDAALTMRSVQETSSTFHDYESILKAYTGWVLHAQSESDPNNIDVRTEPKFNLPDGDVFTGSWCRPQNDGPGLRATALMMFANTLAGRNQSDYVSENLWTGNSNDDKHGGAIKYDLDYVVDQYASNTCDLWEEVQSGDFFWNRLTMKKSMLMGAEFATSMGDSASADVYASMAATLDATLHKNHWTGSAVIEESFRTYDGAVIVGFNVGYDQSDDLYAPTSFEVGSTIKEYNAMFCNEYAINTQDTAAGVTGVLYGRYQNDNYAGGNPWVLTTAALANVLYRGASYTVKNGVPSSDAVNVWADAFNLDANVLKGQSATELANTFAAAGDSVLLRLRTHVTAKNFHLDEQIDRNSGEQMSAEDLTWSYAEVLNAMKSRDEYFSV